MRTLPIAAALAAAGVAGFLFAQWASRPAAIAPVAPSPAGAAPQSLPATPLSAPYVPAAPSVSTAPAAHTSAPVSEPVVEPRPAAAEPAPRAQPTGPPALAPAPPVEPLTLQAVSERDGEPVAIVNGQLVRVGDVLDGARIISIRPDAVEIEKDGRRRVLAF